MQKTQWDRPGILITGVALLVSGVAGELYLLYLHLTNYYSTGAPQFVLSALAFCLLLVAFGTLLTIFNLLDNLADEWEEELKQQRKPHHE